LRTVNTIKERAEQEGVDRDELTDTVLHRTFCLDEKRFAEVLTASVENVKWHKAHREAVAQQQYTGAKYDPNLDILEIKKLVAQKLKALGIKASLRTQRHPNSLAIDIKEAPINLMDNGKPTQEALKLAWQVEDSANEYNFDHGDTWTDYYHENVCPRRDYPGVAGAEPKVCRHLARHLLQS
jgi:hypothetical protein